MNILQVKKYHSSVARGKYNKRVEEWRDSEDISGYPNRNFYFFTLTDNKGYPAKDRVKGYIAFNDTKAVFGINPVEAEKRFKRC